MPTGYTYKIADGTDTTLRGYMLACAKAFGALIDLRDAPADTLVPRRLVPDTAYHDAELAVAGARLAELLAMTPDAIAQACEASNAEIRQQRAEAAARNDRGRASYDRLIAETEALTDLPDGLQAFMLEQLRQSREFDTSDDPTEYQPSEHNLESWFDTRLERAQWDISYHAKERHKVIERTAERNAWLEQFWAALPPEEPTP